MNLIARDGLARSAARGKVISWALGAFFALVATPLSAATIHGTVYGPDGPVPNARVIAYRCAGAPEEYPADGDGNFSIDFPDVTIDCLEAGPPAGENGLVGDQVDWVDATVDRRVHLFLAKAVTISGTVKVPDEYRQDLPQDSWRWSRMELLDGRRAGCFPHIEPDGAFEITCPAGAYGLQVFPDCDWNPVEEAPICIKRRYFSSVAIDASEASVEDVVVPLSEPGKPIMPSVPPNASLIQVQAADAGGIAVVRGLPGAVDGTSGIGLVNLRTGHETRGFAKQDGSFEIPFLAPPGSVLEVRQDPSFVSWLSSYAPGTIVSVPPADDDGNNFAVLMEACIWCGRANVGPDTVRTLGAVDHGQTLLEGRLEKRSWNAGDQFQISGDLTTFIAHASKVEPSSLNAGGQIFLERVFDAGGRQEMTNPVFMSHQLTPTGMPIERRGNNHFWGSSAGVHVGDIEISGIKRTGDRRFEADWSGTVSIPADLPDGIYSLVLETHMNGLQREDLHFENVFSQIFDVPFDRGHTALLTIGVPDEPRLSWVLGLNDFSNGSRGTIAVEDRDRIAIAGRQTANTDTFILPMHNRDSGRRITYRLEPFAPLLGGGNRSWVSPPPVPFEFPSGELKVRITRPDGSVKNLGGAPFAQPFVQQAFRSFQGEDPGNHPIHYFGLTTLDPKYDYEFEQYGLHQIRMTGELQDMHGRTYDGGGTYEVYVAHRLDMEFGVFPNTPFEVGDAFSPTVIVQPGVPADVEIRITHFPFSDASRKIETQFRGTSNRFGYFHASRQFVFEEPGEYRVDVVSRYEDADGVLWMGSETWASVVETPGSGVIAHGLRNRDCSFDPGELQQWVVADQGNICGTHLPFPYHTGDIAWMVDTDIDPYFTAMFPGISVQDTEGTLTDLLRSRNAARHDFYHDFEARANTGEIEIFGSTSAGRTMNFAPDAPDTHWGYFYSGVARPGIRVRETVAEAHNEENYWRFEGHYYDQSGTGALGDETNDFKFQFGGAVYRAPDQDFYNYSAYGSLWVGLDDDDATGTRVMPPFQGNGGGPSGGPIMLLKGEEIDLFFHPGGVRPGSILEVGDTASFAGQIAPTLENNVRVIVTSPSGVETRINGKSNKIGYFYKPETDFVVDEAGVWTAEIIANFKGRTSAGQVSEPYPQGSVLGTANNTFEFYVVDPASEPLEVVLPAARWVQPGKGPLDFDVLPTDELGNARLHHTTVMPGFLMEAGDNDGLTYTYDAPVLHQDFPNLDLFDRDGKYGVDTITMSFMVSGEDSEGKTVYRARQVLLQGEELLAPPQLPTAASAFVINPGLNDAWLDKATPGQGFLIVVFPEAGIVFLAWFTFDTECQEDAVALLGAACHRWLTAQGPFAGDTATLDVFLSQGGVFDTGDPKPGNAKVGTIEIVWTDCENATLTYDLDPPGVQGQIELSRIVPDNVALCEALASQ